MRISPLLRLIATILTTAAGAWFFFLFLNWTAIHNQPVNGNLTDTAGTKQRVITTPASQKLSDARMDSPSRFLSDTPVAYIFKSSQPSVLYSQREDVQKSSAANNLLSLFSIFLPVILIAASIICYIFYRNFPFIDVNQAKNFDPPRLTSQYKKFGERIEALGNPRKIKRLSNKIRFQYYYLENKGLLTDKAFDQLFDILLLLESRPPGKTHAKAHNTFTSSIDNAFNQFLHTNELQLEEPFKRVFYALNRESFN